MTVARYVLDTNVIVQLLRGNEVGKRIDATFDLRSAASAPVISAVSLGETRSLARQWKWEPERIARLHAHLLRFVVVDIRREPILQRYAEIDHGSKSAGRKMNPNDVWIAATASAIDATLLTTDRDFDHLDESVLRRVWIDPSTHKPS